MRAMTSRPAWAFVLLALCGCGGSGSVPVTGQLVYEDGQPATDLVGASVVFDGKASASGEVGPDGRFTLSFMGTGDGAIPGTYKVAVSPADTGGDGGPRPRPPISEEYRDSEKSPLTATVADGSNNLTLTVKRAKR